MKDIKEIVLEEEQKGNIVIADIEGLHKIPLIEFITQPSDGILYDLNRNETTVLTFLSDPKWINDYAVAKVIRALKSKVENLELKIKDYEDFGKSQQY